MRRKLVLRRLASRLKKARASSSSASVTLVCVPVLPASSSSDGSSSAIRRSSPMISPLSSEYLILRFFIEFLAFPPVSSADYANTIAATCKADGENPATLTPANTKETSLLCAVRFVGRNNSVRIEKGALRFVKIDTMFGDVCFFFFFIPFESHWSYQSLKYSLLSILFAIRFGCQY
jgi:hypothetical protein